MLRCDITNVEAHIWKDGVCKVCNYQCEHTGGNATCTQKAVCDICHIEYGEINADNHTGTEEWTQTATEHEKKYDCCGKVTVEKGNHNWKDGTCEVCGYVCVHAEEKQTVQRVLSAKTAARNIQKKIWQNHSGKVVWEQTAETHQKKYDCCDKEVSVSEAHDWENVCAKFVIISVNIQEEMQHCVKKALCNNMW